MKRFRHYTKERVIILSCFGSVIEQQMYEDLKNEIKDDFGDDVFISFSSKSVIKILEKKGIEYKNLPQTLADCDMSGYKKIVVASINLFPTDEHNFTQKIVDGFNNFSYSNINLSDAIFSKTNNTTSIIYFLNNEINKSYKDYAKLYIIHGSPLFENCGISAITYVDTLLSKLDKNNHSFSLEGAFPFSIMSHSIIENIKSSKQTKVVLIPLLLVSGNHFIKDVEEIKQTLSKHFQVEVANSLTKSQRFNLLELEIVRETIKENIKNEITKQG